MFNRNCFKVDTVYWYCICRMEFNTETRAWGVNVICVALNLCYFFKTQKLFANNEQS